MDRYLLGNFNLERNPHSGDLLLMVDGATVYKSILSRAFPSLYFSRTFEDRYGEFSWGVYIKGADEDNAIEIENFCNFLQDAIYIDDDLDESFALSYHTKTSPSGGYERTPVGQLVRDAKPYDRGWNAGNQGKAEELAQLMVEFIQAHPTYANADLLAAVPPSNPNKPFDLPTYLVEIIAQSTNQTIATSSLKKVRTTRQMKECRTIQEKIDNIKDAFAADAATFKGKTIILVDDIYQTGFSINEVGRVLKQTGDKYILGLVATKTAQDLSEDMLP
ncbi:MAG: hypothetical protein HEQ35_04780 [Gloeotrichia echinulata IR180]|jgi:hypothetical protein|nr:hypothetical protein [Gloeotrichia echinulata DEX184]